VPEIAEPLVVYEKCGPRDLNCSKVGQMHLVLPRPVGDRCPSIPIPLGVPHTDALKPVLVMVYARESGDIAMVKVLESSGDWRLDDAAADAAQDCRFHVGTANGVPAKTAIKLRYTWRTSAVPADTPEQANARASRPLRDIIVADAAQPKGLACEEPKVRPPPEVLADPTFRREQLGVAVRISPPGVVSAVRVNPDNTNASLGRAVVDAFRNTRCTSIEPLSKSVWLLRPLDIQR